MTERCAGQGVVTWAFLTLGEKSFRADPVGAVLPRAKNRIVLRLLEFILTELARGPPKVTQKKDTANLRFSEGRCAQDPSPEKCNS